MKIGHFLSVDDFGHHETEFPNVISEECGFCVCAGYSPIDEGDADLSALFDPEEVFEGFDIDIGDFVFGTGAEEFGKGEEDGESVCDGVGEFSFCVFSGGGGLQLDEVFFGFEELGKFAVEFCGVVGNDGGHGNVSETFDGVGFCENFILEELVDFRQDAKFSAAVIFVGGDLQKVAFVGFGVFEFIGKGGSAFFIEACVFERNGFGSVIDAPDGVYHLVVVVLIHGLILRVDEIGEGLLIGVQQDCGAWKSSCFDACAAGVDAETLSGISVPDCASLHVGGEKLPHVLHARHRIGEKTGCVGVPEQEVWGFQVFSVPEQAARDNIQVPREQVTFTGVRLVVTVAVAGI